MTLGLKITVHNVIVEASTVHISETYSETKNSVQYLIGKYLPNGGSCQHGVFSIELRMEKNDNLIFLTLMTFS